jgi:hypothetical protein
MQMRKRTPGFVPLLAAAVLGTLLVVGCQSKSPPPWPWWTDADRAQVTSELAAWHDSISTRSFLEGAVEAFSDSTTIISRDSTSPTGADLVKIARLTGFGLRSDDTARRDSLWFSVGVDSLNTPTSWSDSGCHVIAVDSSNSGKGILRCDKYWVIRYRPDSIIDTTVSPYDTTITWRLDAQAPVPEVHEGQTFEFEKDISWLVKRHLYLRKENTKPVYHLRRLSGSSLYLPSTTDAPSIRLIALTYQGITDTFRLGATSNNHGINNLYDRDSLYSVRRGEPLNLRVQASESPKLKGDRYWFFARTENQRRWLGSDTLGVSAALTFANAGLQHLLVEAVPQSNLFYPGNDFAITVWSLPIRVKE